MTRKFSRFAVVGLALFLVLCSQEKSFLKNLAFRVKNEVVEKDGESLQSALKLQTTLRNVAKSISPAVVNIRTEKNIKVKSPFQDFYNDPFFRRYFRGPNRRRKRKQQSLGSGFIISPDGYILSNNHVVAGADKITIYLADRRSYNGKVIGSDEKTDLALIKIDTKGESLPIVPLGDSDKLQVGDFAMAIGNPFGLNWTFTFGVVSATGRNSVIDPNAPFKNYIQTDVSINPGNSGGPLLNIRGQVVGVNTAIFSTSGGSIGIGFAVPINIAKNVVKQLIEKGKVERGYIGAFIQDIDAKLAKYYGLKDIEGVIITKIESGSPAEKSGLKTGDVVIAINGKKVKHASHLISTISNIPPGKKAVFNVLRDGERKNITVTVGKRGESIAALKKGDFWLGMKFGNVEKYRRRLEIPSAIDNGLVVIDVKNGSAAFEVGIRPGDVVDMINNRRIPNMKALDQFIIKNRNKRQFLLRVIRNGRIYFIVLENK